jgi:hypothetical protein
MAMLREQRSLSLQLSYTRYISNSLSNKSTGSRSQRCISNSLSNRFTSNRFNNNLLFTPLINSPYLQSAMGKLTSSAVHEVDFAEFWREGIKL